MLNAPPSRANIGRPMADAPLFGGPVSLRQIYVPLRAYVGEPRDRPGRKPLTDALQRQANGTRTVVVLDEAIGTWLYTAGADDAVRLLVGAPGSGRTAFCVMLADRLGASGTVCPLYVPLHDIGGEAGEGASLLDILDRTHRESIGPFRSCDGRARRLLILDGLDELGSGAAERGTALRWLLGEVQRVIEGRDGAVSGLRVLLTGDEGTAEGQADGLAGARQTLHLLPLRLPARRAGTFADPQHLLESDQLEEWWRSFGSGAGLRAGEWRHRPRDAHDESTPLPLHEYLVGWAIARGVAAPPQAACSPGAFHALCEALVTDVAVREGIDGDARTAFTNDLLHLLEDGGFAAWQRNRRVAVVPARGLPVGTAVGGLALCRPHTGGAPDAARVVVEFAHRTFAELLAARWVVRRFEWLASEAGRSGAGDWQRRCLKQWMEWYGMTPMDRSLAACMRNEVRLHAAEVGDWQDTLAALLEYTVVHGLPMEDITPRPPHAEEVRLARQAEEALLVALDCCARATNRLSRVGWPTAHAASEWLSRLQGQRVGPRNALALDCLALIDFHDCVFDVRDLIGADLDRAVLSRGSLTWANLTAARLNYAHLEDAHLEGAHLSEAQLQGALLDGAHLSEAHFREANLLGAHLEGTDLRGAHLRAVCMDVADLRGACLVGAHFRRASLIEADLREADLHDAKFIDSRLDGADLRGADIRGTDFRGAVLVDVDLRGVRSGGTAGTTAAQLASAKTLYAARLDEEVRRAIEERYPEVLAPPGQAPSPMATHATPR